MPTAIISLRLVRVKAPTVNPLSAPRKEVAIENFDRVSSRLKALCATHGNQRFRQIVFKHPFLGSIDGVATIRLSPITSKGTTSNCASACESCQNRILSNILDSSGMQLSSLAFISNHSRHGETHRKMSTTVASSSPAWSIPGYLEVRDGHLAINGADALELVRQYDSPLFVFSESRIRANIKRLQAAAHSVAHPMRFFYASKANSNMAVLKTVLESGIDIEVNSGGELFKALRVGFRPDQIIFNGTSKSSSELDDAVSAGIHAINVDSIYEIGLVEDAVRRVQETSGQATKPGKPARIALRLVPEIGTRSHLGLQTALLTSKFGISSSEVLEAFRRSLQNPELIHVCGIHIHVGSQTPDVEPFAEAFRSMWEHLVAIHRETGHKLEHINLGGGIPVNYLRDRSPINCLNMSATCSAPISNRPSCSPKHCGWHANQLEPQTPNTCSTRRRSCSNRDAV